MARNTIQLEQQPFGPPMAKSLLLHLGLMAALAGLFYWNAHSHGAEWGNNQPAGAIQVTMTSEAAVPLPQTAPPTPNVLATQLPSPAPAPPAKATIQQIQQNAIPIVAHQPKLRPKEQRHVYSPKHAQPLNQEHRANYGEAAPTQLAHGMNNGPANNVPVQVEGGDFASRFPAYVGIIQRLVSENWYRYAVDPSTPLGSRVYVTFTIARDGFVSNIRISQPSSSPTLNMSGVQAVQRVGQFPHLPDGYRGSSVDVRYYFDYVAPPK